jgi:NAD(P)-dependent dehydrogenase (short-subunit alcohol dehydrogenase family)
MLTSTAARNPHEGGAAYNAAKAGIEHWVRTVRRERALRDGRPWVCAIEPGLVDTPGSRECAATVDPHNYPSVAYVRQAFEAERGFDDIDTVARATWAALPKGGPQEAVLHFSRGAMRAAI